MYSVRTATLADANDVFTITQEAFLRYSKELQQRVSALEETISDIEKDIAEKTVFVAYVQNQAVGSLRLCEKDGWAYLSRFGVSKNACGDGAGAALLQAAAGWAHGQGLAGVCLHTASAMRALVRFYYSHGFYVDSTEKSRGYVRALMVKPLE